MTTLTMSLPALAERISAEIDARFPTADRQVRQVLALCEEAGELAEAYAAWRDAVDAFLPRERTEPLWLAVCAELADVTTVTYVAATVLGVDLPPTPTGRYDCPARLTEEGHLLAVCAAAAGTAAAWRRWAGMARRRGDRAATAARLVDVHVWACRTAVVLGVDLPEACAAKAGVVLTRGWRESAPGPVEWDGRSPDGAEVVATGVLGSCMATVNAAGCPLATGALDTAAGRVDLLVFPALYPAVADVLTDDARVKVTARVDRRTGFPPALIATAITPSTGERAR
jgi:NTP pyrophosphatase (non-canonical NTP hydrolase)